MKQHHIIIYQRGSMEAVIIQCADKDRQQWELDKIRTYSSVGWRWAWTRRKVHTSEVVSKVRQRGYSVKVRRAA